MFKSKMFKVKNIEDLEMVYSILRQQNPDRQIDIVYNANTKDYIIKSTNKPYKHDPEVPLDLNIEVVYGDSVTGDTPLLLRKNNNIYIETIQSIFDENKKFEYPGFKLFDNTNTIRLEKQYSLTDYQVWSDDGWIDIKKIIRHKTDKQIYRVLTQSGCVDVTEDHSLINENLESVKPNELKIGERLLHSFPKPNSINIWNILKTDITIKTNDTGFYFFNTKDKLEAMKAYYLLKNLGLNISIDIDENDVYIIQEQTKVAKTEIKNIIKLQKQSNQFVYDLETDIGRFSAGIGELQLFNTDSIFIKYKYNREDFESNRIDTFRLATIAGEKLTNEVFDRPPIEMEFEKVFQPFVLLTKKRYIGKKFENTKDPLQLKTIDSKGIALTRRDYCKLVKDCYTSIIDVVMNEHSLDKSIEVFKTYCDKIDKYDVDDQSLCISAMLAKEYSCSLCKKKTEWTGIRCECKRMNSHLDQFCVKCKSTLTCKHVFSLAHVNLAVNLLKRKEEIQVNDRIQYMFVEGTDPKQKKGELAEDPIWAKRLGLKFNRLCYLEQLAKPILGLYKVLLQQDEERLDDLIEWVNKRMELYGGKRLKPSDFKIED